LTRSTSSPTSSPPSPLPSRAQAAETTSTGHTTAKRPSRASLNSRARPSPRSLRRPTLRLGCCRPS
jgi:hypothetical protein